MYLWKIFQKSKQFLIRGLSLHIMNIKIEIGDAHEAVDNITNTYLNKGKHDEQQTKLELYGTATK